MPSTFWVHCSSKQSGKPPVLSRPGKILRGYEAFTSANFKNSSEIRPSAKNSHSSSGPIILRLNRATPRRKCRIHFSGFGVNQDLVRVLAYNLVRNGCHLKSGCVEDCEQVARRCILGPTPV